MFFLIDVISVVCFSGHKNVTREDEIDVEFDDGDSGRIPVSQIRLLPSDYLVLGKSSNPVSRKYVGHVTNCSIFF